MKQPRKNLNICFLPSSKTNWKVWKIPCKSPDSLFLFLLLFPSLPVRNYSVFFYYLLCDRYSVYPLKTLIWNANLIIINDPYDALALFGKGRFFLFWPQWSNLWLNSLAKMTSVFPKDGFFILAAPLPVLWLSNSCCLCEPLSFTEKWVEQYLPPYAEELRNECNSANGQ